MVRGCLPAGPLDGQVMFRTKAIPSSAQPRAHRAPMVVSVSGITAVAGRLGADMLHTDKTECS